MAMFSYRATDATGNIVQGTLEAREERQVVAHLQQGGLERNDIKLSCFHTDYYINCLREEGRFKGKLGEGGSKDYF